MDERALRILLNTEIPGYANEMGYGTSHTQYKVVKDIWIHEDCWIGRIRGRTNWHCYPKRCKSREDVILEMVEEMERRRLLEMFQDDFFW